MLRQGVHVSAERSTTRSELVPCDSNADAQQHSCFPGTERECGELEAIWLGAFRERDSHEC